MLHDALMTVCYMMIVLCDTDREASPPSSPVLGGYLNCSRIHRKETVILCRNYNCSTLERPLTIKECIG